MGWNSQIVLATLVLLEGADDGLFVYDGAAAAGALIASIVPADGTDQEQNSTLQGVTSYDNPTGTVYIAAALQTGGVSFYEQDSGETGTWNAEGSIGYTYSAATHFPGAVTLISESGYVIINDVAVAPQADLPSVQAVVAGPQAETWHNIAFNGTNGWTGNPGRYQLIPIGEGAVWLNGTLTAGGTFANGTVVGTVAALYTPTTNQNIPVSTNNILATAGDQSPHLVVQTSGNIICEGIRAAGDVIGVNTIYSLT